MYTFWVTLFDRNFIDSFFATLIYRGFTVSGVATPVLMSEENFPGGVLTFATINNGEPLSITECLTEVKEALESNKMYYHSIVVMNSETTTWCIGNVTNEKLQSSKLKVN